MSSFERSYLIIAIASVATEFYPLGQQFAQLLRLFEAIDELGKLTGASIAPLRNSC